MFTTRLLTVALALPLVLAALFLLPQPLWALVLLPVLAIAGWEWAGLAGYSSAGRIAYASALAACAVALFYFVPRPAFSPARLDLALYALSFLFWIALAPLWLLTRRAVRGPLVLGVAGWIVLAPMWLALVQLQAAPWALLLVLLVVWVADTAAYLAGKQWGRRKLAPHVSPGKTWEGAIGAAVAVIVYYAIVWATVPADVRHFDGAWGIVIFTAVFVLSVEGDLLESWVKRTAGVKDSGQLLPGHGGVLDRIDGLTASMPAAALAFFLH